MKRTILVSIFAICAITLVCAQGKDRQRGEPSQRGRPTVERSLRESRGARPAQMRAENRVHRLADCVRLGERPAQMRAEGTERPTRLAAESVSISGNLTIAQGMIAVRYNDVTYMVMGLNRFVGFIDGFTEGAQVSLEGYAISRPGTPDTRFLRPHRMTFNGQEYDLARPIREISPELREQIRQRIHSHPRFQARS